MAPNPRNRNILGPANPYDSGAKAPAYTPGGSDALDRPVDPAPAGTDQGSLDTLESRQVQAAAFREAQRVASGFIGDGAAGVQIGRGPDSLVTGGPGAADGAGAYSDVIASEPPVITRNTGSADLDNSGPGQAIG
jgi:hypothetical protein